MTVATRTFLILFFGWIAIVVAVGAVHRQAGGPDWIYYVGGLSVAGALTVYAVRRR